MQVEGSLADQCGRKLEAAKDCGMVRVAESGAAVIEFQPCSCQRFADLMLEFACRRDEVSNVLPVYAAQRFR